MASAYGSHEQQAAIVTAAAAAYGAPVDCTPRAANIAALTSAEAYGAAPAPALAVAAVPSSCDTVHPQMRGGYDAAATATNGGASYGSHLDVAISSSYDTPRAASPTPLSPAQPPQSALAARSLWEEQHIFPWTQRQLIRAAQTVHSAGQHTDGNAEAAAAVAASASSPAASSSVSASYEWRSRRWAYLSSYPATSWNALYQRLFEMVPSSAFELQQKARQQRELLAQFTHFARNTVELLMEEVHLPPHNPADPVDPSAPPHLHTKFLSPVALGGIAGGEKFVLNEVLFKFANDWAGLFGGGSDDGDCCVQKSAANEIRHMNALIAHDGQLLLHAPLSLTMTCLLRVRGCVVMCTALAPIQGRQSLVYGSADAGRDVRDGGASSSTSRVGRVVSQLASAWSLAPHPVADCSGHVHTLPLACDIEIHESRTDGRMYMLDLARFLPPAPPSAPRTMEHLYAVLRPELMRNYLAAVAAAPREGSGAPAPLLLSADAFSGFGSIDHARYAGEVQLVMRHVKYVLMPRAADQLREWWEGLVARPSTTAAQMAEPCAVTNAGSAEEVGGGNEQDAAGQRPSLSFSIAEIVHRCGVNVRYLALVRAYVPAEPSPDANAPASAAPASTPASAALPSLSTLLLYEMVCRTLKQTCFRWIRRMMLAVGRMHQEEQGCSPSAHGPAAAPAAHAANSGRAGWTDADLERWMRRVTMQQQSQQDQKPEAESEPAHPAVASTCHHESALLFALLLSQLFRPAPSSSSDPGAAGAASGGDADGFFQAVLWPELCAKFGKWSLASDRDQFVAECHARGQISVSLRSARMPLLSTEEQDQFEWDCRSVTATSPSGDGDTAGSTARISIFLRMLIESVGLDWAGLQRALLRMGVPAVHTPLEYVRQLVPAVARLDEPSSSSAAAPALTPSVVALLFTPSFEPLLKRVDCLPFLGMAEAEAQLLATLSSRSGSLAASGQSQENPALLGTLWALIALYQVHREEDGPKAAAPPADSSALPPASTGGALQRQQSSGESCYAKGCAILSQIERIYAAMLSDPSEHHGAAAEPQLQVEYARFGWFHLSFGRLDRAREYFVREHLLRLEGARRLQTQQQSEAQNSAQHVTSPAHASALLLLAKSLESLGVIERECGESLLSVEHLQECLRVYQRLYGREGLDFGEEDDAPDATGAAAAPAPAASSDGTTDAPADSSDAASAFRHSMELCTLLTNLANSHGAAGQLASKRRFLERALSIVRGRHSTQGGAAGEEGGGGGGGGGESLPHPSLVSIVNNLSTCYSHASASEAEVVRAREMLEQAVRWNRQINRTSKRSAVDQQHQQQQSDSSAGAGAELAPSQLEFDDEHFSSAALFTNLANVYGKLGEHAKKVSLLQRALSLTERPHGSQLHPDCAVILTNLGMAQGMGGQLAKGLQTLQQALLLKTRLYGTPVHSEVALSLSNMSVLYGRGGDLQQEMRSLTQALQIYMQVLQKQAVAARETAKSAAQPAPSAVPVPSSSSDNPADALPASASALASNPALVFVQQRLFRCKQRMMQQQRGLLSEGRCTFVASGSNRTVHARWFKCATCSPNSKSELGVCTSCADKCHKGHALAEQPPALFYCDCGEGVFATPCRAIKAADETKAAPQVDVAAVGPASPPEVAAAELSASAQPATVIPAAAAASSAAAPAAPSPRPSLHIGIVGCSAEGAALCYRTICAEGAAALGLAHAHPEVSLHTPSLAAYTACIDRDDWPAVGELMLQSASKLARAGADFVICPDNTIHRALTPALLERSALPWLHIAEVVAAQALERGYKRVGLTGTQWLVESEVYPAALRARGLEFARPSEAERATLTRVIMGELVPNGSASSASVAALQCIIARLRDEEGCDSVVLGCTELPLVLNDANSALPTLDSTRLLARAALRRAVDGAADAAAKPADATAASHAK